MSDRLPPVVGGRQRLPLGEFVGSIAAIAPVREPAVSRRGGCGGFGELVAVLEPARESHSLAPVVRGASSLSMFAALMVSYRIGLGALRPVGAPIRLCR